jgi:hypothetical protein
MLKELPPIRWPITFDQVNPLMDMVVQLNLQNAGLNQLQQRAIGITLDCYDIYAKSGGQVDYLGVDGHKRLFQDAITFAGPQTGISTRIGDLGAAHLAIDWNNTSKRLAAAGMPALPNTINQLLDLSRDLVPIPKRSDDEIGVLIRWLQKK